MITQDGKLREGLKSDESLEWEGTVKLIWNFDQRS
jgi:hypothetical protein